MTAISIVANRFDADPPCGFADSAENRVRVMIKDASSIFTNRLRHEADNRAAIERIGSIRNSFDLGRPELHTICGRPPLGRPIIFGVKKPDAVNGSGIAIAPR